MEEMSTIKNISLKKKRSDIGKLPFMNRPLECLNNLIASLPVAYPIWAHIFRWKTY